MQSVSTPKEVHVEDKKQSPSPPKEVHVEDKKPMKKEQEKEKEADKAAEMEVAKVKLKDARHLILT